MACSVNIFSCVQDINRVLSALSEQTSKGEKDDDPTKSEDGWESHTDTWDWNDDSDTVSPLWLQDCCISLSPANDNLAIAKDDKAVFLSSKWDKYENVAPKNKYEISWSGSLAAEEGEHITDVLCIPVASQHRSSQGSPDWTCIVAGFSSGYMRIYLQNGSLIFSQLLHEDKVIRLKCRTWEPHRDYGNSEHVEELAILYPTALVIIDGFSLYQSLRACRNQLAKAQASGLFDHANPPLLAYKKWRFDGQKQILDIASCGVVTPNLFDQLQTASFIGGYNATIRGSAPAMSHYVTSGADPFIAVYSAIEGSSPPLISDVAIAVASKLTSAVLSRLSAAGGWLGWGSTPTQTTEANKPPKPKVEKGTKLPARYGLPDYRRLGNSINLSPNGKLAVTTDEFGRVLLMDIKKGIAVRMWKGYRDAECGWVIVDEDHDHDGDSHSHQAHRTALFLVIYAAKRGILEIWRTEQGPRVAAFNVGKDCRLLYAGHGILGVGHVYRQSQSPPQHTLNCTLIHGDGTLKTFAVPFHTALSDKHSKRMRDLHLLKKLTAFLENIKSDDQDDCNQTVDNADKQLQVILVDIQTPQLQRRGLQCILGTVGLPGSVMLKAVNVIIEGINKRDTISPGIEEREDDHEDTESLLKFCRIQKNLLQTHASLVEILQDDNDSMIGDDETQKNQNLALAQLLGVTKSESTDIVDLLDDHLKSQPEKPITSNVEASSAEMTVNLFLGCFEASSADQKRQQSVDKEEPSSSCSSSADYVCLKKALSAEMKLRLANFIFKKSLSNQSCTESLRLPLDSSGISPLHLMDLLVSLWLSSTSQPCNDVKSLFPLHSIVSIISSIAGSEFVDGLESEPDDSSVSPWWEHVRQTLAQSTSIANALSLAAVCRSVALGMSTAAKKVQSEDMEAESKALAVGDWVSISVEIERWNLLIFQLDDVITIKTFVNRLPLVLGCQPCVMVKNENTNGNGTRNVELSVVGLLSGGVGASARVVAQYLALYDVPPELLGQPRKMEVKQVEVSEEEEAETGDDDRPDEIEVEVVDEKRLEGLDKLQAKFPHSLHQDILWASCALECVAQWSCEKEKTNKLFLAIDHIKCIHCLGLKHGVASILWKKHFREKISALVFLMEKVGKAPKDRLCRKTVDIGYSSLVEFLRAAKVILELISKIEMSDAEVLVLRSEDFWHTGKSNRKSLIEDALDQPTSNVPLVELHIVLVTIMWIIMALDMKSVRPLSLFDSTTKGAFAKDLSTSPPLSGSLNESILQARNKFLTRALSMYVTSMATVDGSADRQSNKETSDWSIVTLWVAEQLDVDVDSLRRHFVCELYSAGLDNYGSEALLSVREKQSVGPSLLVIVGQRLAHTLSESESSKSVNQLSRLPTHISRWIKHQEPSKLSCRSVPLLQTNELLSIVLTLLPNDSSDFTLASNLSEAFKSLLH